MPVAIADKRSRELYARARSRIPGGIGAGEPAPETVGRDVPLFVDHGSGAMVQDVDGNQFIDYVCAWGGAIAGHAHPDVVAAIAEQAALGTAFGAPGAGEVLLAETISRRMPSVQMLRLTASPTDAARTAVGLAGATTGRAKLLRFAGSGHHGLAVRASPGDRPAADVVVPWNDGEAVVAACAEHEFAAIVAAPYVTSLGLLPPVEGFLELLANQAEQNGALLIFDAAVTGFRVAGGGAQERSGVSADLTLLGGVIGGGLPLAAVGGRADLMEALAGSADHRVTAGTGAGPLAIAAGLTTLDLLDDAAYARLQDVTEQLADGLEVAAAEAGVAVVVHRVCGLLSIFFTGEPPRDHVGAGRCDHASFAAFWQAMLARGVHLPPTPWSAWFPSLAHGTEQIQLTIDAAAAAFAESARS